MIAEAAQRYGIVVRDTAAHVTLYAQDPTPIGTNPYLLGPHGYFEGKSPQQLLEILPLEPPTTTQNDLVPQWVLQGAKRITALNSND